MNLGQNGIFKVKINRYVNLQYYNMSRTFKRTWNNTWSLINRI